MKVGGFFGGKRAGREARVEACVPHGFGGVDIADAGDASLIEKKLLERAARRGEERFEKLRREFAGKRVNAERLNAGAGFARSEKMNAAEVAAIGETEDAAVKFQCNIDVNFVRGTVGAGEQVLGGVEPQKPAVEAEVNGEDAAVKFDDEIFSVASDGVNSLPLCGLNEACGRLRFGGDGMENVDAKDFSAHDERTNGLRYGFNFWKFGHDWRGLTKTAST